MPQTPTTLPADVLETDAELVRRLRAGEHGVFDALYRRHHSRLVNAMTARCKDRGLAEDIAHDALLRALERIDSFDDTQPFWPWLSVIAGNLMTDRFRRDRRVQLDPQPQLRSVPDPNEDLDERRLVHTALLDLPERQRKALVLSYLNGWPAVEAALLLGISRNAFDQLLHRARHNLREAYVALDPESARRLGLVPWLWGVLVAGARRARSRLHVGAEAMSALVEPVSVALILPVVVAGAVAITNLPPRASALDRQSYPSTTQVEFRLNPASAGKDAARQPRMRGDTTARSRSSSSTRPRTAGPNTQAAQPPQVKIETDANREGGQMDEHQGAVASAAGEKAEAGHKGHAECRTDFQRAACDATEQVRDVVKDTVPLPPPGGFTTGRER